MSAFAHVYTRSSMHIAGTVAACISTQTALLLHVCKLALTTAPEPPRHRYCIEPDGSLLFANAFVQLFSYTAASRDDNKLKHLSAFHSNFWYPKIENSFWCPMRSKVLLETFNIRLGLLAFV